MALVAYLLRSNLRQRARTWLAFIAFIAVAGGVSMFAIAAWERTATAMDRFLEEYRAGDAIVVGPDLDRDAIDALDEVVASDTGEYFFLVPDGPDGTPEAAGYVNPFSSVHGDHFHQMHRARVVEGRVPDTDSELQVAIDEELASTYGVGVGDMFPMTAVTSEQALTDAFDEAPAGPRFELEVTAIVRRPSDVVPADEYGADVIYLGTRDLYLTPAFHRAHYQGDVAGASIYDEPGLGYLEVRTADGVTVDDLRPRIQAVAPDAEVFFDESDDLRAGRVSDRAIGLQSMAALAVGAVVAVAAGLLAALATTRLVTGQLSGLTALRAMGLRRSTVIMSAVGSVSLVALAGAIGAVLIAIALSPLAPVGLARRAEPDPGFAVAPTVLTIGVAVILLVIGFVAAVTARRAVVVADRTVEAVRPTVASRLAGALSRPGVTCGLQLARPTGGLGLTTGGTVLIAGVAIIGSLTFASSAAALRDDGFGWGWDVAVGNPNDDRFPDLRDELPAHPVVGAATAVHQGCGALLEHDGRTAEPQLVGLEPLRGQIDPVLLEGRVPQGRSEIAIGAVTASSLHLGVGDTLAVSSGDCGTDTVDMTVTGLAVFNDGLMSERIGEGALVAVEALDALGVEEQSGLVLVDYAAGVSESDGRNALRADFGRTVLGPRTPSDVSALERVRRLPVLIAAFVGALALATLAFTLGSTIRASRRDLAVLKVTGLRPPQLAEAIFVQATALVILPAIAGTVLGVVAGRLAWRGVTDGLGAPHLPELAWLPTLTAVPFALAAALAIAVVPARQAARTRPSATLRAE